MRGFAPFWSKEWREAFRSGRLFILAAIFLLLGISAPLTYKFLPLLLPPELSGAFAPLLQPSVADVTASLFKNLAQLGILVLILMVMGSVAEEKSHGQLELVLARPVSAAAILWAKFAANTLQLLLALFLGAGAFFLYTRSLFPPGPDLVVFLGGCLLFALFGVLVVAFTLLASTLLPGQLWAALASGLLFLALSFVPYLGGDWARLSPPALLGAAGQVAVGASPLVDWWQASAICLGLTLLLVLLAAWVLRRADL